MIKFKVLLSAFLGTLFYVIISLIAGRNGFICYNHLEKEKIKVSLQTSEIEKINEDLNFELNALKNDKDLIRSYAHKLDYVDGTEKIVKIRGLKQFQNNLYNPGTVVRHQEISFIPENFCKIVGIIIFILSFVISILVDILKGNITLKKERDIIQGIPVYEMPQI